jgi:hypothetical protein
MHVCYIHIYTYTQAYRGSIPQDFLLEVRYAMTQEGLERVDDACAVSGVVHPAIAF